MPYTTAGKHLMLNALKGTNPTTPVTHVGLFDEGTAITSVTGESDTDIFTKASHGRTNGDLVVLRSLSGGIGLEEEYPYFVVGVSGSNFQLSETVGGSAKAFSTDVSSVSVIPLVEISGGSPAYARKAMTFGDPAEGSMENNAGVTFDVPASTINYAGYFSASTAGTLLAIDPVTTVVNASQSTYILSDATFDLNNDS